MATYSHRPTKLHVRNNMTRQTNTIETFILTLSESQKLYNIRNKKRHNRKSKYLSLSLLKKYQKVPHKHGDSHMRKAKN